MFEDGPLLFAHAGIKPWVPIDEQSPEDLMWIRNGFLNHVGRLSRVVVHGHAVMDRRRPVVTENRISMDTGAYWTGRLSVLRIDQAERELSFWQTDGDHRAVVEVEPIRQTGRGYTVLLDDLSWLELS